MSKEEEVKSWSITQLKNWLKEHNIPHGHCFEKSELVNEVLAHYKEKVVVSSASGDNDTDGRMNEDTSTMDHKLKVKCIGFCRGLIVMSPTAPDLEDYNNYMEDPESDKLLGSVIIKVPKFKIRRIKTLKELCFHQLNKQSVDLSASQDKPVPTELVQQYQKYSADYQLIKNNRHKYHFFESEQTERYEYNTSGIVHPYYLAEFYKTFGTQHQNRI
eukprot:TRINITY_DN20303_c0_g1_i1.p1 TRINITY_DN20303_c0_g1~~TRINITY_DN20303_c0_g1_i1.p1  ORF type:complete len:233 (-),score=57.89 TRINITY_DN20303_c0_g1_i1:508-1155(-)